jgi:hypothetical protein
MGLNQIFPALMCVNIFLFDVEGFTNSQQLLRPKHSAIIRDELFRRSEPLNRCIVNNQNTGQILALKEIAGENRSREGVHRSRFEWVGLWLVWLFWGWLDAIELTILGHNATTRSWGY